IHPSLRRAVFFRPVIIGPLHLFVFWISTEVEDVPLRDAYMLEQLPSAVRIADSAVDLLDRKTSQYRLQRDMSRFTIEQLQQMRAKTFVLIHIRIVLSSATEFREAFEET